jgi:hypothetical protein
MMTSTELTELRQRMGLTQAQMGDGMGGMSGRAYREIESAPGFISLRHEMLAERFALSMAVEAADPRYLPSRLRSDVVSACASLNAPQSIAGQSSSAMAERRKWIAFAGKLLALCVEILKASSIQITEKRFAEPKVLALALLCRTYMNLRGVIAVAREGLVVEARTLTRSCYENMFFVAGLVEKGHEFVAAMYDDDLKSLRSRGEFVLEDLGDLDPLGSAMAAQLRTRIQELRERRPKAKLLNVKEALKGSQVRQAYLFYSQLSGDAAHPSITALKRHLLRFVENGEEVWGLDIHPVEKGTEVADAVNVACNAVLGTCVGVEQILGATTAQPLLKQLFDEYGTLSGAISGATR